MRGRPLARPTLEPLSVSTSGVSVLGRFLESFAIAELDAPYRVVLVLRDLEGLSGAETCAALGLEEPAMKTRLHRARSLLRAKIQRTSP